MVLVILTGKSTSTSISSISNINIESNNNNNISNRCYTSAGKLSQVKTPSTAADAAAMLRERAAAVAREEEEARNFEACSLYVVVRNFFEGLKQVCWKDRYGFCARLIRELGSSLLQLRGYIFLKRFQGLSQVFGVNVFRVSVGLQDLGIQAWRGPDSEFYGFGEAVEDLVTKILISLFARLGSHG